MKRRDALLAATVGVALVVASVIAVNNVSAPTLRSPAGVWVIQQLTSPSQVSAQTGTALATPGVVGYGPRIPVSMLLNSSCTVSTAVLDTQRQVSLSRGKLFKPRIIWGQYTPTCAMGPRISGFDGPAPYVQGGGPNTAFEDAYRDVLEAEAAWAAGKLDVRELDCGWYSLNYSELYNGPETQHPYGLSTSQAETYFIAAHKRLIDIAFAAASPVGVPVGFGLSGHGPIGNISKSLAAYGATFALGTIYMQANGFAPEGEWGGPLESTHDQNVWAAQAGKLAVALQDISAPSGRSASDVTRMWDNARELQADGVLVVYIEQYSYQWSSDGRFHSNAAAYQEFLRQIGLFVPSVLPGVSPSPSETVTPTPSETPTPSVTPTPAETPSPSVTPTPPSPTDHDRLVAVQGCLDHNGWGAKRKVDCIEAALAA